MWKSIRKRSISSWPNWRDKIRRTISSPFIEHEADEEAVTLIDIKRSRDPSLAKSWPLLAPVAAPIENLESHLSINTVNNLSEGDQSSTVPEVKLEFKNLTDCRSQITSWFSRVKDTSVICSTMRPRRKSKESKGCTRLVSYEVPCHLKPLFGHVWPWVNSCCSATGFSPLKFRACGRCSSEGNQRLTSQP